MLKHWREPLLRSHSRAFLALSLGLMLGGCALAPADLDAQADAKARERLATTHENAIRCAREVLADAPTSWTDDAPALLSRCFDVTLLRFADATISERAYNLGRGSHLRRVVARDGGQMIIDIHAADVSSAQVQELHSTGYANYIQCWTATIDVTRGTITDPVGERCSPDLVEAANGSAKEPSELLTAPDWVSQGDQ